LPICRFFMPMPSCRFFPADSSLPILHDNSSCRFFMQRIVMKNRHEESAWRIGRKYRHAESAWGIGQGISVADTMCRHRLADCRYIAMKVWADADTCRYFSTRGIGRFLFLSGHGIGSRLICLPIHLSIPRNFDMYWLHQPILAV